jgi:phage shock protein A
MFGRIINYLKVLFGMKLDALEDPDVLLAQAQQEMKASQAKNRERAVQAITQKNNLQAEVDKTTKAMANLDAKAQMALKNGDRDLALELVREKQALGTNLESLQGSLTQANQMTESIKAAMRQEDERIRLKTAQAMAMKTQWKQAQIETSINKALDGMTSSSGTDAAFERAQVKIQSAQSESAARSELAAGRIENRIASLNDSLADSAANDELAAMEQKMGLAPAPATGLPQPEVMPSTTPQVTTATPMTPSARSAAEQELEQLQQKIGGGTAPPA